MEVKESRKEGYEVSLSHVQAIFPELNLLAFGFFKEVKDGCLIDPSEKSRAEPCFVC